MKIIRIFAILFALSVIPTVSASPEPDFWFVFHIPSFEHGTVTAVWNGKTIEGSPYEFPDFRGYALEDFVTVEYTFVADDGYKAIVEGRDYGTEQTTLTLQLEDYRTFVEGEPGEASCWNFNLPAVSFVPLRPQYNGDLNEDGTLDVSDVVTLTNIILGKAEKKELSYGEIYSNDLAKIEGDYMQITHTNGTSEYVFIPNIQRIAPLPAGTYPEMHISKMGTETMQFKGKAGQVMSMDLKAQLVSIIYFKDKETPQQLVKKGSLTVSVDAEPLLVAESPNQLTPSEVEALVESFEGVGGQEFRNIYHIKNLSINDQPLTFEVPTDGIYTIRIELSEVGESTEDLTIPGYVSLTNIKLQ